MTSSSTSFRPKNYLSNFSGLLVAVALIVHPSSGCLAAYDPLKEDPEPISKLDGTIPVRELRVLVASRQLGQARRLLQLQPRTDANRYMYTLWLGLCLANQDPEQAHTLFKQCMPLHDVSVWTRSAVARVYADLGHYDDALNLLKNIPSDVRAVDAYATRSDCYAAKQQYKQAAAEMMNVVKYREDQKRRDLAMVGDLYMRAGDYNQALTVYNQAFDAHTSKEPVGPLIVARAECLLKLGRLPEAVQDLTTAIESAKKQNHHENATVGTALCHSYLARADLYDKLGKHDLATADRAEHAKLSKALSEDMFGKH